jgi:hypothetical protein
MTAETRCCFEKALISGAGQCARSDRRDIGERIVCLCTSPAAAKRCAGYLSLLRENARFVFRQTDHRSILSNYQELCLQGGGLQGLAAVARGKKDGDRFDISDLLGQVEEAFQSIEKIPLDRIIPRIAAYNPRPHRKKK